jgi:pimeloyl-ACP methyl ester carboxylesterase
VAISAAGHTGIELARRHPDRVRRVSFESAVALPWPPLLRRGGRILFGPAQGLIWGPTRAGLRIAATHTLQIQLSQVSDLNGAALVRSLDPATRAQFVAAYRSLWSGRGFGCDLQHESSSSEPIPQPALIIRSLHDPSVPAEHASRLASLCPRGTVVEVNAESHFIWFGRAADEVWERRLAFLAS